MSNNIRREEGLSRHACRSREGHRLFPEREERKEDEEIRPIFFRDTDRIIHSRAYSRYIDKTQVFSLFENDHITHRVLHVQLVSKVARTLGRFLELNEDLIEAIALGHDLGHPPFGHFGEENLNRIVIAQGKETFCHSAQSFRFLHEVEKRGQGLNLSVEVLDGILCHNGEMLSREYVPAPRKSGDVLLEEYRRSLEEPAFFKRIRPFTLEGCAVRISDIIAYIGRDLEDAILIKLIEPSDVPEAISTVLGSTNRDIVNRLITDLVENSMGKGSLSFSGEVYEALNRLKEFNYAHIYRNPIIEDQRSKTKRLFEAVFDYNLDAVRTHNPEAPIYRDYLGGMTPDYVQNNDPVRIVVDYIAGMTDDYFLHQYKRVTFPKRYGYTILDPLIHF